MNVDTTLVNVRPDPYEVAIVPTSPGQGVRLHLPTGGVKVYTPTVKDVPLVAVLPGNRKLIGWGWSNGWYGSLAGVRNGKHRLDRDAWRAACHAVRDGGIAYVTYTLRTHFEEPRWTANGYRWEPDDSAERAEWAAIAGACQQEGAA